MAWSPAESQQKERETLLNGPKAHGNELFGKKDTLTQRVYFKGVALTLSLIALCVLSPRRPLLAAPCVCLVCAPGNAAEPDNYVD